MKNLAVENKLLATHISDNVDFEEACLTGNATKIISIVNYEMETKKLHTAGAEKLRKDILRKLKGETKVSVSIGKEVLFFVWNSRLSGIGMPAPR